MSSRIDHLSQLPVELFIEQITYLPFEDVIIICLANKNFHAYCTDSKYKNYWKRLVDNTFKNTYGYYENLKRIWNDLKVPDNTYNYLVYTQIIKLLDPITQLMIFFRQGDISSFNDPKFNNIQRFLAFFILGKKTEAKKLLPTESYQPFIDLMEGKEPTQDILNKMMIEMSKEGSPLGVSIFLKKGANIHADDNEALILASQEGHLETVKFLVSQGADIHAQNDAALRWVSSNGHLKTVKFLVSHGANIHALDDDVLIWASGNGHLETVKFLVSLGANIHARDYEALILASQEGHLETVKFLVSQGADIHARDDTALRWASDNGHRDVVSYLKSLP